MYIGMPDTHGQNSAETYPVVKKMQLILQILHIVWKEIPYITNTAMILSIIHIHYTAAAVNHCVSR